MNKKILKNLNASSNAQCEILKTVSDLSCFKRKGVGENIKKLRETLGISQQKLARLVRVSRQTIVNYEINGDQFKKGLKYSVLCRIAHALSEVSGLPITVATFLDF